MKGLKVLALLLGLLAGGPLQAAVSLSGTRLVFDGRFREVSIEARNRGSQEVLLQAWLSDGGEESSPSANLPFVLTPPLSRLASEGRQVLRLMYEGLGMPTDRESLLHLYVLEIPRTRPGDGVLNIAIRQRINVLFRPPGLPGDPAATPQRLNWTLVRDASGVHRLRVENPTVFHAALLNIQIEEAPRQRGPQRQGDDLLVPPGERRELILASSPAQHLQFKALTDYGGQRAYHARLAFGTPFNASLSDDTAHSEQKVSSHD
ncbi:molecular chaperone [Pseudomonas gingeri]|uniref:Molecular chaperone n=1 Tax=Pseudomonas gingeri TaxID=117681 RepID=A0A7Y7XDS8_9PSED|nr:molecular chaperone [Pseudomonas gingeri]